MNSSIDFFNVEGHKSVLDKTNEIFKAINDLYYFKDENDVAVAYNRTFNFHLRLYVNYLLSLTFIIEQSIKTINPNKIYVTKHTNFEEFQVPVSHKDRIIGYLVKKIIKDKNLNIEVVESDSRERSCSTTVYPSVSASFITESRVSPGRIDADAGGV